MKKNKILIVFIIALMALPLKNANAYVKDGKMGDFYGTGDIITSVFGMNGVMPAEPIVNSGHTYFSDDRNSKLTVSSYVINSANSVGVEDGLYGYAFGGTIEKFRGKSVDTTQYIYNKQEIYSTKSELPAPPCYASVVKQTGDILAWTTDDKVFIGSSKEEVDQHNNGSNIVFLKLDDGIYNYCSISDELNDNYKKILELKEKLRKNYSDEYKSQILELLDKREKLINSLPHIEKLKASDFYIQTQLEFIRKQKILNGQTVSKIKGCDALLSSKETTKYIKWAINFIRIGGTVLVIVFGVTDFMNILLSGEEKNFKEAGTKFIKRLVALIFLIFIPYMVAFLLDLSGVLTQYGIEDVYCVVNF